VRALLLNHLNGHTHCLGNDKNVGEDDGGIDETCESANRLEGDFGCDFRVAAAFEEVSVTLGFVILR
jgi:hypothetical protein